MSDSNLRVVFKSGSNSIESTSNRANQAASASALTGKDTSNTMSLHRNLEAVVPPTNFQSPAQTAASKINITDISTPSNKTPEPIYVTPTQKRIMESIPEKKVVTPKTPDTVSRGTKMNFPVVPLEMVRQLGIEQQVIIQPAPPLPIHNKSTLCRPMSVNKALDAKPKVADMETQASLNVDYSVFGDGSQGILPVPVPVYIPHPIKMYSEPVPMPIFVPFPVPVPVFLILEGPDDAKKVVADMHAAFGPPSEVSITQDMTLDTTAANISDLAMKGLTSPLKRKADPMTLTDLVTMACKRPKSSMNMNLKFSYGLTAWKNWSKNPATIPTVPSDPSQLGTEELADCLARFVKEVKKPTSEEYAPDSIYYLCLGIQGYLAIDKLREENIFCSPVFHSFYHALNTVLEKYSPKVSDDGTLVCRIEEQHLWECRQLGCHSSDSLLFTLFYLLTRFVGLHSVESHFALSRSQFQMGRSTDGSLVLRFIPKTGYAAGMTYELAESGDPLKCPVRLYQLYIAKCPKPRESATAAAVDETPLYLHPDRTSRREDSVWYTSETNLTKSELERWLNRVKCVKEIQEALMQEQIQWTGDMSEAPTA